MREIKFRAWDKVAKRWTSSGFWISASTCRVECIKELDVSQFTGLLDKNGKEIYEGDGCKDEWDNTWQVTWSDEYAGFELMLIHAGILGEILKLNICRAIEMEVIGNIHENPELVGK